VPSRREQLLIYRFVADRVQRAALVGDPEADVPGPRRLGPALFAGLMVGAIVMAGIGINALLHATSSSDWRQRDGLVVVAETGARFVYLDGRLRPVANLASARLALAGASASPIVVPAARLAGVPRGPRIGIAGAPDVLPDRSALAAPPWTVCSTTTAQPAVAALLVDPPPAGGTNVDGSAILVRATAGNLVALWHGRRYAPPAGLPDTTAVTRTQPPLRVSDVLLAAVDPGAPAELDGATPLSAPNSIRALCVVWDPTRPAHSYAYTTLPGGLEAAGPNAGRIVIQPSRGAIIQAANDAAPELRGRRYLVTDEGIRYELVSNGAVDAADALGYKGYRAISVPGALVSLIPAGPAIDPDALVR
jgi:hypothetical protein